MTDVVAATASGAMIVDVDGREYLDFVGGIGVMNVGHRDPEVVAAIKAQADRLLHTCIHIATYAPYVELCETLARVLPHGEHTKCLLLNSGAEAVENAIKIARQATGRGAVICFGEAFHGRTLLCATLTSKIDYKRGCGPFAPDIHRMPFPDVFRGGGDADAIARRELDRLRRAFRNTIAPEDVAAVIIELVQGEGGFNVVPEAYVRGLREICDEHGIVLIFDEVQSGFARTGNWGAYQHFGVIPDLSTWAKSMGGGLPISAVIGRAEVMDAARPGTVGGTYGGNPVSCAAAIATIRRMEELDLNARARVVGDTIRARLEALRPSTPAVVDVRGLGAMIGIELAEDGDVNRPATDATKRIVKACLDRGLLVITAGIYANIIRILSPLVITDEELDRGLSILEEEVLRHVGTGTQAPSGRHLQPAVGKVSSS
ncbi:MAG: aspartate aminotransferase family protein [Phycisphaerales bacterium]|nr:aspartate aminotransferase family protein [Phycisphaerales bacterium]